MTVTTKTCPVCDLLFLPKAENQRYCGANCKKASDVSRSTRNRRQERDPADYVERACPVCQQTFIPKARNQVYDQLKCQHVANKRRQRGRALGKPEKLQTQAERGDRPVPKRATNQKPNLSGDWFPGWNGPYPPWRTPLEIELLESGKGRVEVDDTFASQTSLTNQWGDR